MIKKSQFLIQPKVILALTLLTAGLIWSSSTTSCAQSSGNGCAGDTWISMANQAALQTRREDLMNKRFIVKADSVLQYSCFADELKNTVVNTKKIFSNGEQWVNKTVHLIRGKSTIMDIYGSGPGTLWYWPTDPPKSYNLIHTEAGFNHEETYDLSKLTPFSLDTALFNAVAASYNTHIYSNFNHAALSGTTNLGGKGSLCHSMSTVWKAAKCKNFDGPKVFWRLEELVTFDPREYPPEMPCG